jgi:hypothetical protein
MYEQNGEENNLLNSVFLKSDAEKMPKTAKKQKRINNDFKELNREKLIKSLLKKQSKNKRLL